MGNATSARTVGANFTVPAVVPVDSMIGAGPGWYFDPDDQAIYRFWDGERWTNHRSDLVMSGIPNF